MNAKVKLSTIIILAFNVLCVESSPKGNDLKIMSYGITPIIVQVQNENRSKVIRGASIKINVDDHYLGILDKRFEKEALLDRITDSMGCCLVYIPSQLFEKDDQVLVFAKFSLAVEMIGYEPKVMDFDYSAKDIRDVRLILIDLKLSKKGGR